MMPVGATKSNEETAAVLTYIRNSFGNSASAVTPEMVANYKEVNKEALSNEDIMAKMLNVSDLIVPPPIAVVGDAPALPVIPSAGLGASGMGIAIFLIIGGLSVLGALRMKAAGS